MQLQLCYIKKSYFERHKDFVKILDIADENKQSRRTHLCVMISFNKNKFYIPLRNNLRDAVRKYGRIGHAIPSRKRKNAGLDYRYALIVNNALYIEKQKTKKIPEAQYRKIIIDYEDIKEEFTAYLNGFVKAAKKGRIEKEPLYRESSLINFRKELNID